MLDFSFFNPIFDFIFPFERLFPLEHLAQDKVCMFAAPVTEDQAPGYFDVVSLPMDLRTMRDKAAHLEYQSFQHLRDDFELMCRNAVVFNPAHTRLWQLALSFFKAGSLIIVKELQLPTKASKYAKEVC